jgi:hypothetical protein
MRFLEALLALPATLGLLSGVSGTFFYPNPQTSLLEHVLVDTHGAHSSGFANAITPCSKYPLVKSPVYFRGPTTL